MHIKYIQYITLKSIYQNLYHQSHYVKKKITVAWSATQNCLMYIYNYVVCSALGFTQHEGMMRSDRGRIPGGSSEGEGGDKGAGGDDVEARAKALVETRAMEPPRAPEMWTRSRPAIDEEEGGPHASEPRTRVTSAAGDEGEGASCARKRGRGRGWPDRGRGRGQPDRG
jgi:hypothetical protein